MTTTVSRVCARLVPACNRLAAAVLCGAVRGYQLLLSPLLGRNCRFRPTCSVYFRMAVEKHGPWRGAALGLRRICRCHPWSSGGEDLP